MKIGILTLPLSTNYGGILQVYALQIVLKRMGHDTMLIDKNTIVEKLPLWKAPIIYIKRLFEKYILRRPTVVFLEEKVRTESSLVKKYTQSFIDIYIHPKILVDSLNQLEVNSFDAIIVGSDQVWRRFYFPAIEDAYLKFAEDWNIKRIAYAASFGTDHWEYSKKQTKRCGELLNKFDAVSIREKYGVKMCSKFFHREAEHVLDPTMLLDVKDYISLFEAADTPKSKGDMLVYFLDETEEKELALKWIVDTMKCVPFRVNSSVDDYFACIDDRIQPPVENWIRGFFDAKFVLTDSFHACVFSILFNKPFVVCGNQKRGIIRLKSLLEIFELENRLILSVNELSGIMEIEINWDSVNTKLDMWKHKSLTYLFDALKNE